MLLLRCCILNGVHANMHLYMPFYILFVLTVGPSMPGSPTMPCFPWGPCIGQRGGWKLRLAEIELLPWRPHPTLCCSLTKHIVLITKPTFLFISSVQPHDAHWPSAITRVCLACVCFLCIDFLSSSLFWMRARSGWFILSRSTGLPRVCDDRGQKVTALILKLRGDMLRTFSPGNPMGPWGPGKPCTATQHRSGCGLEFTFCLSLCRCALVVYD